MATDTYIAISLLWAERGRPSSRTAWRTFFQDALNASATARSSATAPSGASGKSSEKNLGGSRDNCHLAHGVGWLVGWFVSHAGINFKT